MNKIKFTVIFLLACVFSNAQDTIKLVSGGLFVAKIIEVRPTLVKYKNFNNPDGPEYTEDRSNIAFIKYSNGFIENIQAQKVAAEISKIRPTLFYKIEKTNGKYFFIDSNNVKSLEPIKISRVLKTAGLLAKEKQLPDLKGIVRKTKKNKILQNVFGIVGAPVFVVGLGFGMIASYMYNNSKSDYDRSASYNAAYLGIAVTTASIGFEITSIVNGSLKRKRLKQTVKLYNEHVN